MKKKFIQRGSIPISYLHTQLSLGALKELIVKKSKGKISPEEDVQIQMKIWSHVQAPSPEYELVYFSIETDAEFEERKSNLSPPRYHASTDAALATSMIEAANKH
jgi:hypothetical protein